MRLFTFVDHTATIARNLISRSAKSSQYQTTHSQEETWFFGQGRNVKSGKISRGGKNLMQQQLCRNNNNNNSNSMLQSNMPPALGIPVEFYVYTSNNPQPLYTGLPRLNTNNNKETLNESSMTIILMMQTDEWSHTIG